MKFKIKKIYIYFIHNIKYNMKYIIKICKNIKYINNIKSIINFYTISIKFVRISNH